MRRATFWNMAIVCMPVDGTSKGVVASEARGEGRVTGGALPAMLSKGTTVVTTVTGDHVRSPCLLCGKQRRQGDQLWHSYQLPGNNTLAREKETEALCLLLSDSILIIFLLSI